MTVVQIRNHNGSLLGDGGTWVVRNLHWKPPLPGTQSFVKQIQLIMFCLSFRDILIHTIFSFLPPQVSFRSAFPNNRSKFLFRPSGLWFWPNLCIQEVRQCCCSYYLPVEEEKKSLVWLRTIVAGSIRYAIILVAQSNKPFFLKVKLSMGGWGGDSLETLMLLRSSIELEKWKFALSPPLG